MAEQIIKNLNRRHIEGFYCPTNEDAVKKVLELIPDGSSVTWGGTMTVRDLGIPDALRSRNRFEQSIPDDRGCTFKGKGNGITN